MTKASKQQQQEVFAQITARQAAVIVAGAVAILAGPRAAPAQTTAAPPAKTVAAVELPALFRGRVGAARAANLQRYGGDAATERAVLAGLRWLKTSQQADGSWDLPGSPPAGAALAVLAFLGHGEGPDSADFGPTVQRALDYLAGCLDPDGLVPNGYMYAQGMVALALAEGYGFTRAESLREPAQRAVNLILQAQRAPKRQPFDVGGWRYLPTASDADLSISSWQIAALQTAAAVGLTVAPEALTKATTYLWNSYGGAGFTYTGRGENRKPSMTGAGVFCLYLLGQGRNERLERAVLYVAEQKPGGESNGYVLYSDYYLALASFQAGGNTWRNWNMKLRSLMLPRQPGDGPWRAPVELEQKRGPVYATTFATLILETYYRYPPLAP